MSEETKPDWDKVTVMNGWLVYNTGEHNCVGGTIESSGMHEMHCGYEPLIQMDVVWRSLVKTGEVKPQEQTKPDTLPEPSDYFRSRGG
jgi:hypothetical protein